MAAKILVITEKQKEILETQGADFSYIQTIKHDFNYGVVEKQHYYLLDDKYKVCIYERIG